MKENFPLARAENSVMVPFLLAAASASLVSDSGNDGEGGESVKRNVLSRRMIWLKLGLRFGSSTQHDCMMKASSGEISSGRVGLSCCIIRLKTIVSFFPIKKYVKNLVFTMNKNCFKQIPQSTEVTTRNRGIVYYQSAFDKQIK